MSLLWPYRSGRRARLSTYDLLIDTKAVRAIAKEIREAARAGRLTAGIGGASPRRYLVSYNLATHRIGGLEVAGHLKMLDTPENVFLYFIDTVTPQEIITLIHDAVERVKRLYKK